jgi:hypothetical protein
MVKYRSDPHAYPRCVHATLSDDRVAWLSIDCTDDWASYGDDSATLSLIYKVLATLGLKCCSYRLLNPAPASSSVAVLVDMC